VPADTLAGAVYASGTIRGNLYDFDLNGAAGGENVVARGNFVRRFRSLYRWTDARTPQSKLAFAFDADSVSAMGFGFDTASVRVTYANSSGHVELAITQDDTRQYGVNGDYTFHPDRNELRLADMTFRFDTTYWSMPHPSTIRWGGPGIRVTDFELRNRGNGRLYANGLLPTNGVADFTFAVDNFPLANVTDITQTDIDLGGILTLHGSMTGTMSDPAFRGAFGVVQGTYNGTAVPELLGRFGYADRQLVTHVDMVRGVGLSPSLATVDARLPVNLAFRGVTGPRLLPEPMSVDLVADSLPLDLIPQFTDLVSQVKGRAAGKIVMRGTLKDPTLVGGVTIIDGAATLNATGAAFTNIGSTVRMANDTVYVDSLVGDAKGPVRVRGTVAVADWSNPVFALYLTSSGARLMNNNLANIRVDAGLALTGPYNDAYVSGAATIVNGIIYAPEPSGRHVVGAGDPALFNVLDTANAMQRDLFPPASPLVANMRVDVLLSVKHDTWVRNREANVEIYTDDPLAIHDEQQSFSITGIVTTDRGEYNFMSKRFQIQRGSAMFIGSPDLNPTLQITGEYQVQAAARGSLNIRVLIGGTLHKPTLSLESDAQPPKTQSELLSLLAFGQSTTSLIASTSSSIAGSAATMDLFGVGAQMAVRRLAGVALGVAVDQVQIQAGRAFGTDVFDITPADVPQVSSQGIGNFLTDTKFEAGKYINGRTYVSVQEQATQFGAAIDHRTSDGWRFTASFEPRIILLEPRLQEQPFKTARSIGGFVLKEWRW
jgi:translocation and assembly module TamB